MEMKFTTDTTTLLFSIIFVLFKVSQSFVSYNVVDLGADPKGIKYSTYAFDTAWSKACKSSEPAGLYVPEGTFLLNLIQFNGPCNNEAISIKIKGTLVAPSDYNVLGSITCWFQVNVVKGLSIEGGVLDGKGKGLWDCKASHKSCPQGTTNFGIFNSENINITSLTSQDSQMFHMQIYGSKHVNLEGITILAPENSPNTDGIHIQSSSFISIFRTNISTGDDCISIGPTSDNLWMENVHCGPGHGISIGGLGREAKEGDVHTVTVRTSSFSKTQNGLRIKSLGTPYASVVRDVTFEHATMDNVAYPIIIDQNYCAGGEGCTGKPSSVQISNITYNDITGSSATQVAVKFDCSPMKPCKKLIIEAINLNYIGKTAESFCANAFGKSSGTINPPSCLK